MLSSAAGSKKQLEILTTVSKNLLQCFNKILQKRCGLQVHHIQRSLHAPKDISNSLPGSVLFFEVRVAGVGLDLQSLTFLPSSRDLSPGGTTNLLEFILKESRSHAVNLTLIL